MTSKKLLLALVLLLALLCEPTFARLVRIPLTKTTTREAGKLGQSVTSYFAPVSIGTPPVKFNLQFEIALGTTFVPHREIKFLKSYLNHANGFLGTSSRTSSKVDVKRTIEYQQCSLTGKLYEDIFTFGTAFVEDTARSSIRAESLSPGYGATVRQNFLAISKASTKVFKDLPIDGFIGLAPNPIDVSKVYNIMNSLNEAKLINDLQFSFVFNRTLANMAPNGEAELTLGSSESSPFNGQLNTHRLATTSANIWALNLRHVSFGQQVIACNNDCQVSFSSALNEVYGPLSDVNNIYNLLGVGNPSPSKQLTKIDCRQLNSDLPLLTFTIDSISYVMLPTDYIKKEPSDETCYIAILPNEGEKNHWTLGTNFLESYYSVFDIRRKSIGFAKLGI